MLLRQLLLLKKEARPMKADAIKLDGGKAGSVDLDEAIFGLEPRADILHRVVRWQRNNAQAGTHKVKTRSETSYSTKKIYRQKAPVAHVTVTGMRRSSVKVVSTRVRPHAATATT